jgi:hypothetical protein
MLLTMTCLFALGAAAAIDLWRGRGEADLRRRWRSRTREPWRLT